MSTFLVGDAGADKRAAAGQAGPVLGARERSAECSADPANGPGGQIWGWVTPRHVLILEWVAFVAMVIDHGAKAHIFSAPGWTIIGRVAFPLFVLTFAYNVAKYGRCNIKKLVSLGLIATPATVYLFAIEVWQPNIMFAFPVGWLVFRFFTKKRDGRFFLFEILGLWLLVGFVALGPNYDVRGTAMIALAIGYFTADNRWVARGLGVGAILAFLSTLSGEPYKVVPATLLIAVVVCFVRSIPGGSVSRNRASVWGRLGFGKWYVVHAYVLCGVKFFLM